MRAAFFILLFVSGGASGCAPANNAGGATESEGETDGTLDGGEDDVGVEECEPTLASIQTSIFDARCSTEGCHGAESPAASLSLTPGNSLPQLVEVASTGCEGEIRVVPGQREGSLLYQKLLPSPVCGERMPFGGELPAAHIECIGAWIDTLEGSDCEKCGGDVCVDLTSDPIHCGECDLACPPGVGCEQGVCVCPDGQTACGEACVNTLGDVNHCGGCGNVCADGKVCYLGLCADTCADLEDCGGSCVDLSMDPMNCGACGTTCDVGAVCDGGSCACDPTPVSFAAEVLPVLVDRCTSLGCHAPPMPRANLDLTAAVAFSELVGISTNQCGGQRTRVIPGDPAASYVVQKLDGTDLCFGTQMPKGAPPLSNQVRATIKTWICQGAQDN